MKIKSRKVGGPDPGEFTVTTKFEVVACGNISGNNNKFYCLELQKKPKTNEYQLFTHYGRIGMTNTYEVRDTTSDLDLLDAEYNKILKAKKRPSKGYQTVDTQEPSVGSYNIRNKASSSSTGSSSKGDLKILSLFDDQDVRNMVQGVWEENIHNITNMTTMNVSTSGISSPLGPLTLSHLEKASAVLNEIKKNYGVGFPIDSLNNTFFSLIPHSFGMSIPQSAFINDDNKFMVEYDLLEQMKSVLKVTDDTDDEPIEDIGVNISVLEEDNVVYDWIKEQYVSSRAKCHKHLFDWNINKIFNVNHKESTDNYQKLDGEEMMLFHGSRACNILSIMMNGLMVPPSTAGHVTGRMFGDGIYGASASTKALNYATGYWAGGAKNKNRYSYMFLVKFSMGKIYYPTSTLYKGPPKEYDSVWAKKEKVSLANDEFIVYNTNQAQITHLIQLTK